ADHEPPAPVESAGCEGEDAEQRRRDDQTAAQHDPGGTLGEVSGGERHGCRPGHLRCDLRGHQFAPENSLRRDTIQRANALTANVTTNRIRPVAISTLMLTPYASGNDSAMLAAIVCGLADCSRANETRPGVAERTIATAIVSPSARPSPSTPA